MEVEIEKKMGQLKTKNNNVVVRNLRLLKKGTQEQINEISGVPILQELQKNSSNKQRLYPAKNFGHLSFSFLLTAVIV